MSEPIFSSRILRRFAETAAVELGVEQFNTVLALSKLPGIWAQPQSLGRLDALESARTYAALQAAIRTYFGRGARGVLLRIGRQLWHHLLEDAALAGKAQAVLIRRLPMNTRRKAALELLSRLLSARPGDITLHTLDLDLLLADHGSPTTHGFQDRSPICFVTQGLIGESLLWATAQSHDVEETSCRARGENACEFKVTLGS